MRVEKTRRRSLGINKEEDLKSLLTFNLGNQGDEQ